MQNPSDWLVAVLLGRLLIYLWQQFPLPTLLENYKTIRKLHDCDLCAGVWVYGVVAWVMGTSLLEVMGIRYVPILSELFTGAALSFLVHVFVIGWNEKFNNIVVV
jgi:hypothetical protein